MADESQPETYERPKIERREVIEALINVAPIGSPSVGVASSGSTVFRPIKRTARRVVPR
jgi:hypothetical protein